MQCLLLGRTESRIKSFSRCSTRGYKHTLSYRPILLKYVVTEKLKVVTRKISFINAAQWKSTVLTSGVSFEIAIRKDTNILLSGHSFNGCTIQKLAIISFQTKIIFMNYPNNLLLRSARRVISFVNMLHCSNRTSKAFFSCFIYS